MKKDDIIKPIAPSILRAELSEQLLLRRTNRANNEIYIFRAHEAPNLMLELGRLREEAFRYYGGGSGKAADIDAFDLDQEGYQQLIVWDPNESRILGGYRFILGKDVKVDEKGSLNLASSELFDYSDRFVKDYLPLSIELGRSFVRLDYQQAKLSPKSLFVLDNLWDGLGALILLHDKYEYFFGKVTMYKEYHREARDLIIYYLQTYHGGKKDLMTPRYPVHYETSEQVLREVIKGDNQKEDYKALNKAVRERGVNIPPLINAYMGLTPTLMVYGTSLNNSFSGVEETGILIPMTEIAEDKKRRHMESFLRDAAIRYRSKSFFNKIQRRLGLVPKKQTNKFQST